MPGANTFAFGIISLSQRQQKGKKTDDGI